MKYVAIKVEGIPHWMWFKKEKTTHEGGVFTGKDGWGKGGAQTTITNLDAKLIIGRMESTDLQYSR